MKTGTLKSPSSAIISWARSGSLSIVALMALYFPSRPIASGAETIAR